PPRGGICVSCKSRSRMLFAATLSQRVFPEKYDFTLSQIRYWLTCETAPAGLRVLMSSERWSGSAFRSRGRRALMSNSFELLNGACSTLIVDVGSGSKLHNQPPKSNIKHPPYAFTAYARRSSPHP